jgi:hypothetical protein
MDENQKLIKFNLVVHGAIDGFSWAILFLDAQLQHSMDFWKQWKSIKT